jgi:uncharacterized membrane protein
MSAWYDKFLRQKNSNKASMISTDEHPPRPVWRELFKTTEGRILLLGIAIALAGLITMGVVAFWSPQTSGITGAMSIADMMFGMLVSMSIGYAAGYGHAFVIPVIIWVETVMVLLFYPVFVFSMRKLAEFPRLRPLLDRTQAAAEHHHDKVHRYGIAGLFIFVWFPFWMTGPVLGSAIGYLLGLPAWVTLSVVLAGAYFAMVGWAYLLFDLYTRAAVLGSWAPVLIVGLVVLAIFAVYLLNQRGRKCR